MTQKNRNESIVNEALVRTLVNGDDSVAEGVLEFINKAFNKETSIIR